MRLLLGERGVSCHVHERNGRWLPARTAPLPSLNALATITLFASTLMIAVAGLALRSASRRDRGGVAATAKIGLPVAGG